MVGKYSWEENMLGVPGEASEADCNVELYQNDTNNNDVLCLLNTFY